MLTHSTPVGPKLHMGHRGLGNSDSARTLALEFREGYREGLPHLLLPLHHQWKA